MNSRSALAATLLVLLAVIAVVGGPELPGSGSPAASPVTPLVPEAGAVGADPAGQGGGGEPPPDAQQRLWQDALRRIEEAPAITALSRCQGHFFGVSVLLQGRYWQLNRGGRAQVRYEIVSEIPGKSNRPPTQVLQLSDGRFLWEIAEQGDERQVARTDLQQLQQQAWHDKLNIVRLGSGGLPKLLATLRRDFDWSEAQGAQLDGLNVWKLSGRWTASRSEQLAPGQSERPEKWPPYLPDRVEVQLGADDLFPYRLEYFRQGRSLLVCEFYEVATPENLDERLFQWQAAEPQIEDRTELVRRQLELAAGGQP